MSNPNFVVRKVLSKKNAPQMLNLLSQIIRIIFFISSINGQKYATTNLNAIKTDSLK